MRKSAKIFGVLLLGLLGGYSYIWHKTSSYAKNYIQNYLIQIQKNPGVKLSYDLLSIKGFPFTVKVTLDNTHLEVPMGQGGNILHFKDTLTFQIKPWNWNILYLQGQDASLSTDFLALSWAGTSGLIKFDKNGKIKVVSGKVDTLTIKEDQYVKKFGFTLTKLDPNQKFKDSHLLSFEAGGNIHKMTDQTVPVALKLQCALPKIWLNRVQDALDSQGLNGQLGQLLSPIPENNESLVIQDGSLEIEGVTLSLQGTLTLDQKLQPFASWAMTLSALKKERSKGSSLNLITMIASIMGWTISESGEINISGALHNQELTLNDKTIFHLPIIHLDAL